MIDSIRRLRQVSDLHAQRAAESKAIYRAAAHADAEYKRQRAKAVLRHKATRDRMSQAEAETRADADDQIHEAYVAKLVSAADSESHKDVLRHLREAEPSARTEVATEREADRIHATRGDRP